MSWSALWARVLLELAIALYLGGMVVHLLELRWPGGGFFVLGVGIEGLGVVSLCLSGALWWWARAEGRV